MKPVFVPDSVQPNFFASSTSLFGFSGMRSTWELPLSAGNTLRASRLIRCFFNVLRRCAPSPGLSSACSTKYSTLRMPLAMAVSGT
jgi:hypothetical protein